MNAETATDADRAANMHMELAQYYEWMGTLPRNDAIFFEPEEHKDELVDESEKKIADGYNPVDGKNYYDGIEITGYDNWVNDRDEERINNDNMDDYYDDHPNRAPPDYVPTYMRD